MTHIWVPRAKIIEPKKAIAFPTRIQGHWRLDVRRPDGRIRETRRFPNLITDAGLNAIGTSDDWLRYCAVGTGSAAPNVSDTQLQAQVGSRTNTIQDSNNSAQGSPPYYGFTSKTFRFGAGAAAGNLAEIGIFTAATSGICWSRALILDSMGSPTTLTVLSDEFLDATYEVRIMVPTDDVLDTVDITGVGTLDLTIRAANATSLQWAPGGGFRAGSIGGVYFAALYTGAINESVTGAPSGTSANASSISVASYGDNNLYRESTATWDLNAANFTIRSTLWSLGTTDGAGGLGAMQAEFSPTFAKTNSQILTLVYRHTWARG